MTMSKTSAKSVNVGEKYISVDGFELEIVKPYIYKEGSGHSRTGAVVRFSDGREETLNRGALARLLAGKYIATPGFNPKKGFAKDHLGNKFPTAKIMCEHHGMNYNVYKDRINKLGWSIEDALTLPVDQGTHKGTEVFTKDGRRFRSINEAARKSGISEKALKGRLASGMSLDEALEKPVYKKEKLCKDHLGNTYSSLADMAAAYSVPKATLYSRLKKGWDIKRALTAPVRITSGYEAGEVVAQHNGQKAEIVEVTSSNKSGARGIVRFEDGTAVKNASLPEFRRGNVKNPNFGSRISEESMSNCGLIMKIIAEDSAKNITVQFEDGAVKAGASYYMFKRGRIAHPTFCADTRKNGTFMGYKIRAIGTPGDGFVYYQTEDIKTGKKDIMTPQQMMKSRKKDKICRKESTHL